MTRGELELGLMANMGIVGARKSLLLTSGVAAAFSGESLAALMRQAGASEKSVMKIEFDAWKSETASAKHSGGGF